MRHFLCSLKTKPLSYEISLLVKSCSQKDLNQAKSIITKKLKKINDFKYKKLIRKYLNKIGIDYDKNYNLYVKDEVSWQLTFFLIIYKINHLILHSLYIYINDYLKY